MTITMTAGMTEQLLLSVPQVAKILGVRRETCWRMARAGRLGPLHGGPSKLEICAVQLSLRFGVDLDAIRNFVSKE